MTWFRVLLERHIPRACVARLEPDPLPDELAILTTNKPRT